MAVDIGRMYVTKSEAQSFVDSAAMAAAVQLDGSTAGLTRATNAASGDPKKWGFGLNTFSTITTKFATSPTGPWTTSPPSPANYYYAQVSATVTVPMYLIRVLVGSAAQVGALAVAGRSSITTMRGGEFPFSPYTRTANPDSPSDPYGYMIGNQYTLRWGAPGNKTTCGTDATNPSLATNGKVRGYCCVANNSPTIRQAIVSGDTDTVTIGSSVPMDTGAKNTEMTTIAERVNLDSDTSSTTYSQYVANGFGNGERVVVVPVNDGPPSYKTVGYAGFFLLTAGNYSSLGGNDSACAEYIGAWIQGVATPQISGGSGAFRLKLYQ
jgi:hypothetical protein